MPHQTPSKKPCTPTLKDAPSRHKKKSSELVTLPDELQHDCEMSRAISMAEKCIKQGRKSRDPVLVEMLTDLCSILTGLQGKTDTRLQMTVERANGRSSLTFRELGRRNSKFTAELGRQESVSTIDQKQPV